jgi:hypothetical protein
MTVTVEFDIEEFMAEAGVKKENQAKVRAYLKPIIEEDNFSEQEVRYMGMAYEDGLNDK